MYSRKTEETMKTMEEGIEEKEKESLLIRKDFNARVGKRNANERKAKDKSQQKAWIVDYVIADEKASEQGSKDGLESRTVRRSNKRNREAGEIKEGNQKK